MDTIGGKIQSQYLLKIKRIVDNDNNGNKFIIVRTDKNNEQRDVPFVHFVYLKNLI